MLAKDPYINLPIIPNIYPAVILISLVLIPGRSLTEENKIIETASLTMPSPNIIENSFGYFSGLIIVKAQTESVAHRVAEYIRISYILIFNAF